MQSYLPCLFTHLPREVNLLLLELGSLALQLDLVAAERMVRELLALPRPPVLALVTVRGMCKRVPAISNRTVGRWRGGIWEYYAPEEQTAWSRAEAFFERICARYRVSCLSYYEAVAEPMRQKRPGFGLDDTTGDCLHPSGGHLGTSYLTDIVLHWLSAPALNSSTSSAAATGSTLSAAAATGSASALGAAQQIDGAPVGSTSDQLDLGTNGARPSRRRRARPRRVTPDLGAAVGLAADGVSAGAFTVGGVTVGGDAATISQAAWAALPSPLDPRALNRTQTARCYAFARHGGGSPFGALRPIKWRTAQCPSASASELVTLHQTRPARPWSRECTWLRADQPCPSQRRATAIESSLQGWAFCLRALTNSLPLRGVPQGKISPGVMALAPGALIEVVVDSRITGSGGSDPAASLTITLEHLTSYEGMGVAMVRCVDNCLCQPQWIDAHRTSPVRNASVFVTHAFDVRGAHERCVLQVRLLRVSRPGGGGNQFKLRTLQVITARPEAQLSGSTSRPVHA